MHPKLYQVGICSAFLQTLSLSFAGHVVHKKSLLEVTGVETASIRDHCCNKEHLSDFLTKISQGQVESHAHPEVQPKGLQQKNSFLSLKFH